MYEHIGIVPVADLETTARVVGKIVDADFKKDVTGFYEEFPAYIAKSGGIEYALLGHPEPEYDLRELTKDEYELIMRSDEAPDFQEKVSELIKRLPIEGGVVCRIL
jgi:hypothetical protein